MKLIELRRGGIVKGLGLYFPISLAERLRNARGIPQAVVKVISYGHGSKGVGRTIDYISRKGELPLETETGDVIQSRSEQKELVRTWSRDFDQRKTSRDGVHIAFSMPKGSNPEALRRAVRAVLRKSFSGHESVFAIHQDKPHPHAHVVVKMRGRESGKKLRLNKPELFKLREAFAEAAREQGIQLAVSPRSARGVGRKSIRQALYHLRKRGITPNVYKRDADEIIGSASHGDWQEKPWERAMRERNEHERRTYFEEAQSVRTEAIRLKSTPDQRTEQAMLKAAEDLERYSRDMPVPKTRRQILLEKIAKRFGIKYPPPRIQIQHPKQEQEHDHEID